MKSIVSFPALLLLAFLFSCSAGNNDLAHNGLKGSVKEIRDFQCNASYENEEWVPGIECENGFRVVQYDAEGNFIQAFNMTDCGDTTTLSTTTRVNGEVVEELNYNRFYMTPVHSKMVLTSRTLMDRVSEDQVNFEVWQEDRMIYEGANYYDSKGRIEREVKVVNNRQVILHYNYEKNLLVEMWQEELDGTRSATQQYEYTEFDDQGNWILRLVYNGEEKITPDLAITRLLEYYD